MEDDIQYSKTQNFFGIPSIGFQKLPIKFEFSESLNFQKIEFVSNFCEKLQKIKASLASHLNFNLHLFHKPPR